MTAEVVANCPRCGATNTTFDIHADVVTSIQYNWKSYHETFCVCRRCLRSTIFVLALTDVTRKSQFNKRNTIAALNSSANRVFEVVRPITERDVAGTEAPDHVPQNIKAVYEEGTASLSAACFNAAGAMFRLTLDLATKNLLPTGDDLSNHASPPNREQTRKLAHRLDWLFDQGILPRDLRELATAVRHDGNDAAHDGTLTREDAEDLNDFAEALLQRIFTEPGRLALANARRLTRRGQPIAEQ